MTVAAQGLGSHVLGELYLYIKPEGFIWTLENIWRCLMSHWGLGASRSILASRVL